MHVYTFSEARQNLASVLEEASRDGEIMIKRRDGSVFIVKPEVTSSSPLDVEGVNLNLTSDEIVDFVKESRSSRH